MTKRNVTISVFAREELKARFEKVYLESEMNSKGEFLNALLENYLNPVQGPAPIPTEGLEDLRGIIQAKDQEIAELKEAKRAVSIIGQGQVEPGTPENSHIVLETTVGQREIIAKCYDDQEGLGRLILLDLVKMALQWVQVEKGGLFSNDRYNRLFLLKGIETKEFEEAFEAELEVLDKEG